MDTLEQRTMARVSVRLVPFLMVCYFVAYLDRVNVSFAALTMNKDLGLSASAYGLGAGIFFLAYGQKGDRSIVSNCLRVQGRDISKQKDAHWMTADLSPVQVCSSPLIRKRIVALKGAPCTREAN